jgi:hypothetical protein
MTLVFVLVLGCGGKKDDAAPPADNGKATADQCKKAYDHLAELNAKKTGGTAADWLSLQKGNLESCPKMVTSKGIDCMTAMTEWDMMKWANCNDLK